jgi:hypothetical protein
MVRIIETNLSIDNLGAIQDHQSRVIETESWMLYVDEFIHGKTIIRNSCIGSLHGATIPREAKIENLTYDEKHLMCDITNWKSIKSKKFAYLV